MASNGEKKEKKKQEQPQPGIDAALDLINIVILAVLVGIFFLHVILRGQIFFAGDIMNVYTPWQKYNQEALAAGRMPLWCDDFFMGFPLFAESQGALFYPVTRLVYFLSPPAMAFSFDVLAHFILAGWFQYFFARTLRLSPSASMLSAVAFAFSGMFLSMPINFTIFRSIVWIPLIFTFLTIGARKGSLFFPLMAAISMVFQMMGGSLQVTGITVLALVPWAIFLMVSPGEKKQASAIPLLQFILTLILAFGLYAFQLLPTYELTLHAWRGTQGGYEVASAFSFPPEHFIDMFMPTFFGSYADGTMLPARTAANFFPYIGLAPLLLVIPGMFVKKRGSFILLILVFLFLALAVGKFGLLYPAVYSVVPFFDKFRAPDRFWMIAVFAGTILAGFGLDRMIADSEKEESKTMASVAGIMATIFFLIALFLIGAVYFPALRSIWNVTISSIIGFFVRGGVTSIDQGEYHRWIIHAAFAAFMMMIAVAAFHFAIALFGQKGRGSVLGGMMIIITIADLYAMSLNVPAIHTTDRRFFTNPPHSAQVLRRDGEPNRFYSFLKQYYAHEIFDFNGTDDTIWYNGAGSNNIDDYYKLREALTPNIFMHWGLASSNGFASLFLERYFDMEGAGNQQLYPLLQGQGNPDYPVDEWSNRTLLVDLMASRYILTPAEFANTSRFRLVDGEGPVKVYYNAKAMPRAWVARPEAILAETRNSMEQLYYAEIDPTRSLILEPIPGNRLTFPGGAQGEAYARIRPVGGVAGASDRGGAIIDEQVLVDVSSPQPAYLILADTWYPGWRAEIDGVPVNRIYRAFGYFRAIEIPAGEHFVRFYYDPQSFRTGKTITVVTSGTFLLLLIVQAFFFNKPRKKKTGDSNSE